MQDTTTEVGARTRPASALIETNIPARLDRLVWGRFHTLVVLALGITWILDGLEVTLAGAVAGALKESPTLALSNAEVGLASSFYLAGAVLGALLFGWLTDRLGRKRLFFITLGVYLVSTASTAFAWDFASFALFRFLTGAGIGGEYTAIASCIQEFVPARYRGHTDLVINGSFWLGAALGAGASLVLLDPALLRPDLGWRAAFLMLAAVTLIALALTLPQVSRPKQALSATGAAPTAVNGADRVGWRLVALSAAAFLCCVCMGVPLVHLASFVGTICGSAAIGATSLLIAMLAGTVGRICFGLIADRIGNLPSYALASAIQTVCVVAYPWVGGNASALALSAVFGFGFAGNMTCLVLCVRDAVPATRFGAAIGVVMLVAWAGM